MRFKNCTCVCCSNTFSDNDDVVVCPVCGSPHHRECWAEKGNCSNSSLHEEGFVWTFPEELKPKKETNKIVTETVNTNYRFKNGENAVVCPHCNSLNYGNDAFCMKCRKPFVDTDEFTQAAQNGTPENADQTRPPDEDSFEYFQQFGGVRPDVMIDGIPVIEYSDYIGVKKSGRYIRRFLSMERFGKSISVSIAAFIFGPVWFLYRKMNKVGILYLLALLVLTGAMTFCSLTEGSKQLYAEMGDAYAAVMSGEITVEEMQEILMQQEEIYYGTEISRSDKIKQTAFSIIEFIQLALRLALSFAANAIYKKKIKTDILRIRTECSDMPTYRRTLHERGGTSIGGAVIGVVAASLVYMIQMIPVYYYMFSSIM